MRECVPGASQVGAWCTKHGLSRQTTSQNDRPAATASDPTKKSSLFEVPFSRSLIALDMNTTLIAVVELSLSSWLVAGIVPGVERQPLKKLKTDENALLTLLNRWRDEAVRSGHKISRIAVAFEAGRDGFWLARWLKAHGIVNSGLKLAENQRLEIAARPHLAIYLLVANLSGTPCPVKAAAAEGGGQRPAFTGHGVPPKLATGIDA